MKSFAKNAILKKILIVFITIIMTSNFIMPNYVCAVDDALEEAGETLVSSFFYLLAWVGDTCISTMQEIMLGYSSIGNDNTGYKIAYSPGMIFANNVPALDINFIKPMSSLSVPTVTSSTYIKGSEISNLDNIINRMQPISEINSITDWFGNETETFLYEIAEDCGYYADNSIRVSYISNVNHLKVSNSDAVASGYPYFGMSSGLKRTSYTWYSGEMLYKLEAYYYHSGFMEGSLYTTIRYQLFGTQLTSSELTEFKGAIVSSSSSTTASDTGDKKSIAAELRNDVATWYTALRTIALVGLLSVLVYIGIRIILSSTSAQDKAKYKNMIKDWFVAICILFVLHYVMAFMLQFTQKLNGIINENISETTASGRTYDSLISTIRDNIGSLSNAWQVGGNTVMYLALVILTGVFTFQYLKRVVFMAFLTMVAPMIALTYPIDKVKDGKAQAFSYWLKEYIFNCLIQPVHLLLYTILITNAITFATDNILYAIVALAFLVPAEKFIKEMFGMKSQSPTGTLGAAAGGAMVMSMLNKIKSKPPKDDAGSGASSDSKGVRTANNSRTATSRSNSSSGNASLGSNSESSSSLATSSDTSRDSSSSNKSTMGSSSSTSSSKPRVGAGLSRVGKNLAIKGVDGLKSAGIGILKKAPGAALGATIGLAATVASGGENAVSFIGGGAAAGSALSSNIAGNIGKFGKDSYEEYQKGKYGVESYQNKKFDKEFYKSDGYRMIEEDTTIQSLASSQGVSVKELTQTYLEAGITDSTKIREALQNGITGANYAAFSKAGIESPKKMAKLQKKYTAEQVASRVALAKNAPKTLKDFKAMMVGRKFDGREVTAKDAEKIYKELVDFF